MAGHKQYITGGIVCDEDYTILYYTILYSKTGTELTHQNSEQGRGKKETGQEGKERTKNLVSDLMYKPTAI